MSVCATPVDELSAASESMLRGGDSVDETSNSSEKEVTCRVNSVGEMESGGSVVNDNHIDANDYNYLEDTENIVENNLDVSVHENNKDKVDDPVIVDLIEDVPDVAFVDNFNTAFKLPSDSEEQIRQSVANFTPADGFERLPLAKKDRSVIHQYGVVVVKTGQLGRPQLDIKNVKRFYCCLVSAACIKNKVTLALSCTTTSTATNHLNKHAISSQRSIQIAEKKSVLLNEVQSVIKSTHFLTDQKRTKGIIWVKNFVIMHFVPFDFLQHHDIRSGMAIMGNGGVDTTVPYEMLHPKNIKHMVVEIYAALKKTINEMLEKNVKNNAIPCLHFSVDKVKSKISGENFLGLRVYFLDKNGQYRSFSLSIKHYRPASTLNDVSASNLLKLWLDYSFQEFGISLEKHVGNSVTDAGESYIFDSFISLFFSCNSPNNRLQI